MTTAGPILQLVRRLRLIAAVSMLPIALAMMPTIAFLAAVRIASVAATIMAALLSRPLRRTASK